MDKNSSSRCEWHLTTEYGTSLPLEKSCEDNGKTYGNLVTLKDLEHVHAFSEVLKKFRNKIISLRRRNGESNGYDLEYLEMRQNVDLAPGYKERISPQNAATSCKNRYMNVLPLEDTRVRLSVHKKSPSGDYINANYIHGGTPGSEKTYIACSAPPPPAIADFWQMVWDEKVIVILMLTRFVENHRTKADIYWKTNKQVAYFNDDIQVVLQEEINVSLGYILREFKVSKKMDTRTVRQVQLTTWPDHGILTDFAAIESVLELVKNVNQNSEAPVVVHCSAGIGRSGTIIAIDIILKKLYTSLQTWNSMKDRMEAVGQLEDALNIYKTVGELRNQRPGMVQTTEQYAMIYEYIASILLSDIA